MNQPSALDELSANLENVTQLPPPEATEKESILMTDKGGALAVPLGTSQVEAASRLHGRLSQWTTTDAALESLGAKFPAFDVESSLLKVSALNQLYGTNVYAVMRMARHVSAVMIAGPVDDGVVERLAALPKGTMQTTDRRHLSFASKFAHFFLQPERFPIYDSYAAKMLKLHIGRGTLAKWDPSTNAPPYSEFVAAIETLRRSAGLACTARALDRHLWLCGLCMAWRRTPTAAINVEARQLFESSATSTEVMADLTAMEPA